MPDAARYTLLLKPMILMARRQEIMIQEFLKLQNICIVENSCDRMKQGMPGRVMASNISVDLIRVLGRSALAHQVLLTAVGPCNATVTHVLSANSSSVTRTTIHMLLPLALNTFRTSPRLVARYNVYVHRYRRLERGDTV